MKKLANSAPDVVLKTATKWAHILIRDKPSDRNNEFDNLSRGVLINLIMDLIKTNPDITFEEAKKQIRITNYTFKFPSKGENNK